MSSPQNLANSAVSASRHVSFNEEEVSKSLVTIGYYDEQGGFRDFAGGVLIYSGVVLTSLANSFKHYKELNFSSSLEVTEEDLYVRPFKAHKEDSISSRSVPVRVEKIIPSPDIGRIPDATISILTLLFISPTSYIADFPYLPLTTTEDLAHLDDLKGAHLWGVGVRGFSQAEPPRRCPAETHTQFGILKLHRTPREIKWMKMLFLAFPGRIVSSIHYDVKEWIIFRPAPEVVLYDSLKVCNASRLCMIAPPTSLIKDALQFQCAEHSGYPLLWRIHSGELRVFAILLKSLSDYWFYYDRQNPDEVFMPPSLWAEKHLGLYYDLIYAHRWIQEELTKLFGKNIKTEKKIINHLDQWPNNVDWDNRSGFNADTSVAYLLFQKNGDKIRRFCSASIWRRGVIVTAAHCLKYFIAQDNATLYAALLSEGKEMLFPVRSWVLHPSYLELLDKTTGMSKGPDLAKGADLALIFFDGAPPISEVVEIRDLDDLVNESNGEGELWLLTGHHRYPVEITTKSDPNSYKYIYNKNTWVNAIYFNDLDEYLEKNIQEIQESEDVSESIISEVEYITQEPIIWENLQGSFDDLVKKYSREVLFPALGLRYCERSDAFCVWAKNSAHRLEKYKFMCSKYSGSPVYYAYNDSKEKAQIGIIIGGMSDDPGGPTHCLKRSLVLKLSSYSDWMNETAEKYL